MRCWRASPTLLGPCTSAAESRPFWLVSVNQLSTRYNGSQTPSTHGYMGMEIPTCLGLHPELNPTLELVREIPTHIVKGFHGYGDHGNYTARVGWGKAGFVSWVCCRTYLIQFLESSSINPKVQSL